MSNNKRPTPCEVGRVSCTIFFVPLAWAEVDLVLQRQLESSVPKFVQNFAFSFLLKCTTPRLRAQIRPHPQTRTRGIIKISFNLSNLKNSQGRIRRSYTPESLCAWAAVAARLYVV